LKKPRAPAEDRRPLALLLAACAATYLSALPGALFWDNEVLILNNVFLRSWRYVPQILTTSLFAGSGEVTNYYRPVSVLALLVQYQLWGPSPLGFHAFSILLHVANAALVYFCARRLLGSPRAALIAAAIFALHPLQNETVNYADHQEGMLTLLFGLSSFLLLDARRAPASCACWALCLLSKEEGVTFFPILALAFLMPRAKTRENALKLAPHLAILAVYLGLRLTVLNFLPRSSGLFAAQQGAYAGLGLRLLTFAKALLADLRLVVWPTGLHFDRDMAPAASALDPRAWGALALDAAILAALGRWARGAGRLGLAWFLFALVPYCGLVSFNNILAEHFLYIPLAGLAIALAQVVAGERRWPRAGTFAAGALLGFWTFQNLSRNRDWRDPVRLYRSTLAGNPGSYRAANNLGVEEFRSGRIAEAGLAFQQALRAKPDYAPALNNVGAVLERQGKPRGALEYYLRSFAADPAYVQARRNAAGVYYALGQDADAVRAAEGALAYYPQYADALEVLGAAAMRLGDLPKARAACERAAAIRPSKNAFTNLAIVYRALGLAAEAKNAAGQAARLP